MKDIKIMFVDDEEIIANMAEEYLSDSYDITVCLDPVKALKEINNNFYDILITDYKMPGITGIELLEEARRSKRYSYGILFTAFAPPELEEKVFEQKLVSKIVEKPFRLEELKAAVDEAIEEVIIKRQNQT